MVVVGVRGRKRGEKATIPSETGDERGRGEEK